MSFAPFIHHLLSCLAGNWACILPPESPCKMYASAMARESPKWLTGWVTHLAMRITASKRACVSRVQETQTLSDLLILELACYFLGMECGNQSLRLQQLGRREDCGKGRWPRRVGPAHSSPIELPATARAGCDENHYCCGVCCISPDSKG